jgi:DNA-binding NtrC family response regulator
MVQGEAVELNVHDSLPLGVLGRALVRRCIQSSGWAPMVQLCQAASDPESVERALSIVGSGFLLVLEEEPCALPLGRVREQGARVVIERHGPGPAPSGEELERLLRLDSFHAEATDPALRSVRQSLLANCRSGGAVTIEGPPGTGRGRLARWAHCELEAGPLSCIANGEARHPEPGSWVLVEEPSELDPDRRHQLLRELQRRSVEHVQIHRVPSRPGPRPDGPAFAHIVGESQALGRVLLQAQRAASTPLPVLVLGEPGVGKELMAAAIHAASARRGSLVAVDVSAMAQDVVESELFGHVKGAFTGADRERKGAFRSADGGTLFLDELGNMDLRSQARLLRVLQEGQVRPVGSDATVNVDVRVVAASNADLEAMVARGDFRADLLRRLDAVTLRLPPLRDRGADVLALARSFARQSLGQDPEAGWLSAEAQDLLLAHHWPGNARELRNVILRAALEARGGPIQPRHLGPLAPTRRRPAPLLVTTSDRDFGSRELKHLPRSVMPELTAVTLRVPSLRDRGPEALRARILHLLDGKAITPQALGWLERRPWWGNLPELEAAMRVLSASPGCVTLESVRAHLSHLVAGDCAPIRALLHPAADGRGGVTGFHQEVHQAAAIIGRAQSVAALDAMLARGSNSELGEHLRASLGPAQAGFFSFPHLPLLSRAHLMVSRGLKGLEVQTLPGARLPVMVRSIQSSELGELRVLHPGESVSVGAAGEIRVLRPGRPEPYLQLFLFSGAVALEEHGVGALAALPRISDRTMGASKLASAKPLVSKRSPPRPRVWCLDGWEQVTLNQVVMGFRGGDFSAHLEAHLLSDDARLERLRAYLLGVRPTQYCGRLYSFPMNEELRQDLVARIQASQEPERCLGLLPLAIRKSLQQRGAL